MSQASGIVSQLRDHPIDTTSEDIVFAGGFHEFVGVFCELLTSDDLSNLVEFW